MMRALLLLLAGAFALAGCSQKPEAKQETPPPSPTLYEIADNEGQAVGWLFGTIHALPDGIEWRTERLDSVVEQAHSLVVEVANLNDTNAVRQSFVQLATTPNQPNIRLRVAPEFLPEIDEMLDRGNFSSRDFANIETWAAALMLAQTISIGDPENGVDRALIDRFSSGRIYELEGALTQLGIFDGLSHEDQADLLEGIAAEYRETKSDPTRLQRAWLSGDEKELTRIARSGIMADQEIYAALLAGRNRDWMTSITSYIEADEKPLIAVGAAHLAGSDGLIALLELEGYVLTRIQ